jgi:arginine N-succinyltransferase
MSYADADVLSSENKGFIRDLFPSGPIYASLLSRDAQEVIGKVGAQTRGVEKMLRRVGFRYAERIDPFDGGPHFVAEADEISLVRDTLTTRVQGELAEGEAAKHALVAREFEGPPYFRAVATHVGLTPEGVRVAPAAAQHLELGIGDAVTVLPLP